MAWHDQCWIFSNGRRDKSDVTDEPEPAADAAAKPGARPEPRTASESRVESDRLTARSRRAAPARRLRSHRRHADGCARRPRRIDRLALHATVRFACLLLG